MHNYRAMHYSTKCGIAIACRPSVRLYICLSVCDIGGSGWHWFEILGESRGGVGKSGVLEHKSGNISEMREDREKVTMRAL